MSKNIIKLLLKISSISILLVILFNVGVNFFDKEEPIVEEINQNKYNYIKSTDTILGGAGVAISTNLGIRYKQKSSIPITIYKDVISISEIMSNKDLSDDGIITVNMLQIKEYLNVMSTDVKRLINNSNDKPSTLKAFIAEIEYRYKSSSTSIKNLITQKGVIEQSLSESVKEIETLKIKINNDFGKFDSKETLKNIDKYILLKKEVNYSTIYVVFINQFIKQYTYLNGYNKTLLDTLINNKEAIIKDAYVILPDSGNSLLRKLELLYTEEQFKGYK